MGSTLPSAQTPHIDPPRTPLGAKTPRSIEQAFTSGRVTAVSNAEAFTLSEGSAA
jgi:hypothetical protein